MNEIFRLTTPTQKPVPILVSVPHAGTAFPKEVQTSYKPHLMQQPDDTDWFVDQLYDFAPDMGITLIAARYSRWLIDLNRDPKSKPLYADGRMITALTPVKNFLEEPIYLEPSCEPNAAEIQRRLATYYWPYYEGINTVLRDMRSKFDHVLFWDAHSIRRYVKSLQAESFPDLILGNNDQQSAHPMLIKTALASLEAGPFPITHNHPFKGGHLTRYIGNPAKGIHALQLEMVKELYMDDAETNYHPARANQVRKLLMNVFEKLISQLRKL